MNKPVTKLFFKRFQLRARLSDDHICGSGNRELFEAEVTLAVQDLDSSGFVTHNFQFIDWLRARLSQDMLVASCEQLAGGIVFLAETSIGKRLLSADVKIFNETGHAELNWKNGEEVPEFPREATKAERKKTEKKIEAREEPGRC